MIIVYNIVVTRYLLLLYTDWNSEQFRLLQVVDCARHCLIKLLFRKFGSCASRINHLVSYTL